MDLEKMALKSLSAESPTPPKMSVCAMLAFLLITISAAAVLEFCYTNHSFNLEVNTERPVTNNSETSIKFSMYPPVKAGENHLQHVVRLLEVLGYTQTSINELDWNLLWAHEYPFQNISEMMRHLLPHQTVNHIPGIGFLTSKVDLSTASLPFMPKAFRLPQEKEEFLKYTSINPDTLFVEKHNKHRYIKICSSNSINLSSSETFLQEFIENPFLVDGHKFDIGVYAVITSVDPLLSYIYTGDVLFRYCSEKYFPFDSKNVKKYVVGNDYVPTWEVPSLIKYFEIFGGGMRASFDAYVRDQSMEPSVIWTQVENIVRETILAKKNNIVLAMRPYKTGNFFELLRFDLIVDDELKVHLMEINMSPNLSSAHFKQNALLYEQVLYSVFNLVGVGSPLRAKQSRLDDEIITSDKNIAVNLSDCAKYSCHKSCYKSECKMCLPCLKGSEIQILRKAHFEHLHKVDMKRIYPKAVAHFFIATNTIFTIIYIINICRYL
ncbi:probable tubulin polyglutamylase ttll-15 isoform X1 [Rhagoletis pomonella]|uniref:probable tubulin polyglutamylase ttll-15 isoform X1 n=1 Tax=Rhagoletis pomonella TaxID=28610 RepID=UPI00177B9CB8|nr:probable tubulin polyglutamylase ttll-15 isoform X1 [Rhagoletis pomonella]